MIIALSSDGGILIGLSEGNLRELRAGHPILKDNIPGFPTIRIMYGETEGAILAELMVAGVVEMPQPDTDTPH